MNETGVSGLHAQRHLRFRPDIEGMRAIAILMVVAFHAGVPHTLGGYLGVDVFFVLSGYLITGVLVDEVAATGRVSLTAFWARRARRLLPAAALITVVVVIANAVIYTPFDQRIFADTARAFALYGSNILFAVRSTEYFGGAATRDPLLHTWSLSVEEQFYLFFAPLVLALATLRTTGATRGFLRRLELLLAVGAVASLIGCLLVVRWYPVIGFFALPTRAWEFACGALAVVLSRRAARAPRALLEVASAGGLLAVVLSVLLVHDAAKQPLGLVTIAPVLGTMAFILAGCTASLPVTSRALTYAPVRLIGRLSYSWYLWHWPALVYLRELSPRPSLRLSCAVALLSLVPASITYLYVERPVRFSPSLQRYPRPTVVGAGVLAALTVLLAWAGALRADRTLASPPYRPIVSATALPDVYRDGCHLSLVAVESPPCMSGAARGDTTVALFGDSHAAQWYPALEAIAHARGWRLVSLTKTACPANDVEDINFQLGRRYTECEEWRRSTTTRLVRTRPRIIVVASARVYNLLVDGSEVRTDTSATARESWSAGLERSLVNLAPAGSTFVVLEDTPRMTFDVSRCLAHHLSPDATACATPVRRAVDTVIARAERLATERAASKGTDAHYVSLNDVICDGDRCPVMHDGIVRYQDSNHLSVAYARALAPDLSRALTTALSSSSSRMFARSGARGAPVSSAR